MAAKTTKRQSLKSADDAKKVKSLGLADDGAKPKRGKSKSRKSGKPSAALIKSSSKKRRVSKSAKAAVGSSKSSHKAGRAKPAITKSAKRTLQLEIQGLADLLDVVKGRMAAPFSQAVDILNSATGRVIVTGIGKSGLVGLKIAATFSSTGTAAFFVHPSEASHGDLGMISSDDVILAMSWSGETVELGSILTYSRRFAVPLIAITSRADSALGKAADVVLQLPRAPEACPHGLAPTTSTNNDARAWRLPCDRVAGSQRVHG